MDLHQSGTRNVGDKNQVVDGSSCDVSRWLETLVNTDLVAFNSTVANMYKQYFPGATTVLKDGYMNIDADLLQTEPIFSDISSGLLPFIESSTLGTTSDSKIAWT